MSNSSSSSSGIGLFGLLGVTFVVLKLTGAISWSWWWVTAPFWGGAVLWIMLFFIITICVMTVKRLRDKPNQAFPRKRV